MTSPEQPARPRGANEASWDPNEQPGELYRVDIDEQGLVSNIEKLAPRPAVWIGSWLDYNNGVLHGDWIHADQADEAIEAAVQTMLARSPTAAQSGDVAEEWGIFDTDHFGSLQVGEQESIAWIGAVGRGIAEHGPAFAAYAAVVEELDALSGFADDYLGQHESVEAYAEHFADDAGYNQLLDDALPPGIRPYVQLDTDAIARDMQAAGDIHAIPDGAVGVWLFAGR